MRKDLVLCALNHRSFLLVNTTDLYTGQWLRHRKMGLSTSQGSNNLLVPFGLRDTMTSSGGAFHPFRRVLTNQEKFV